MIVGGFPRLSETFILSQITGLIDLGHQVDIFARRGPREDSVHPAVVEYGLEKKTHAFELPSTRSSRLARAVVDFMRHFPRHPVRLLRCANILATANVYGALSNIMHVPPFLDTAYDVFFCHFGGNGADFLFLKRLFPAARFVTMFHGDDLFLEGEQPGVFSRLRERGDLFLVNTDVFGGALLRRMGFPEEKIKTFHYALDLAAIPFGERRFRGDRLRLLTIARLVEKKGISFAIEAVARMRDANPRLEVEYRIIGDGELRRELEDLVARLQLTDTVQFLGALSRPAVVHWLSESDVYLLPSLMEQAGMVLAEAQASGLPVVATRVGGVPEMVAEHKSAVLVPPADPAAIADALQQLIRQPESWPAMGHAGRHLVEEQHDARVQAARLEALLTP
jgi:colanic acid/amylovoran biosynthesis glycosyltransferase